MTDTTKRYRLNTTVGNYKIGDEVSENEITELLNIKPCIDCGWLIPIPNSSEPVKERIEVDFEFINDGHNGAGIYMVTSYKNQIHPDKFPAIKQAIENVLHDTVVDDKCVFNVDAINNRIAQLYEIEKAFLAGRETYPAYSQGYQLDKIRHSLKYKTLSDYLSSLNLNSNDTYTSEYPKATNDTGKEDIRDNKINLLEEDLAVVHHYLDDLGMPRKDGVGTLSICGRIKKLELHYMKKLSEIESEYLSKSAPEQPTNDNAFVWTDDLVADFIFDKHWTDTPYPHIYKFKESKSKQSAPVDTWKDNFLVITPR